MPKKKIGKVGLIKKGTPLPRDKRYKFDSAHLKSLGAEKRENQLVDKNYNTKTLRLPQQFLIFKHKPLRITPKSPRISR